MHIDQANIFNLKSLWQKYGIEKGNVKLGQPKLYINDLWHYRCWFDDTIISHDFSWLSNIPQTTIIPIWPMFNDKKNNAQKSNKFELIEKQLQKEHWHCILEQTAMFLALSNDC